MTSYREETWYLGSASDKCYPSGMVVWAHVKALITKEMSTTDGAIDHVILWFGMDILLSTTENSYANKTSAINKILFLFQHKSNNMVDIQA